MWPLLTLYGPAVLAVKFWSNWNFDNEKLVSRSIPSVRIGYACWIVSNRALKLLIPKKCWSVALQLSLHHEISFDGLDSPSHSCTWSVTNSLKTTDNFNWFCLWLDNQLISVRLFLRRFNFYEWWRKYCGPRWFYRGHNSSEKENLRHRKYRYQIQALHLQLFRITQEPP